jgi:hypothetical protein
VFESVGCFWPILLKNSHRGLSKCFEGPRPLAYIARLLARFKRPVFVGAALRHHCIEFFNTFGRKRTSRVLH